MTINAVSRSFACWPHADGKRYTREPVEDSTPELSSEWMLSAGEFAPTRIDAVITSPRPTAELTSASRYLWAHSGFDYIVPICVMGGAPPFWFEVSGVAGATVERKAPTFNPGCYSWGVVTIPAATVAGWSGVQTITVDVYDQEHTTTPAASVTWTITKDDAKFIVLDAVNGSPANAGTLAAPFQTIEDYYGATSTDDTYAGKIAVYRTGTYALDRWGTQPGTSGTLYWPCSKKPVGHIAYPGESPVWDFNALVAYGYGLDLYWSEPMNDWFFGGIQCYRGKHHFKAAFVTNRVTLWDVDCVDMNQISETNDNLGFFSSAGLSSAHDYFALADIRVSGLVNAASLNNGSVFLVYHCVNLSVDGCVFTNSQCSDALFPKTDIRRGTITGCSVWTGNTPWRAMNLYNSVQNASYDSKVLQARYCRTAKADDNLAALSLGHATDEWGTLYVDRCTHVGGNRVENEALGIANMSECVVVNDLTPVVDADIAQTSVVTYTRAGSTLDADGKLPAGATRYTRGFELRSPT